MYQTYEIVVRRLEDHRGAETTVAILARPRLGRDLLQECVDGQNAALQRGSEEVPPVRKDTR